MLVTLEPLEYTHAAMAGFMRQASNVIRGRRDAFGYEGGGYDVHVLGAVGEFAAAKGLGLFWAGPGRLRAADVGGIQVRTRSRPHYDLIVHPEDPDGDAFLLVTCEGPLAYRLRGWLRGSEAKKQKYWADPAKGRPAYFVPQAELLAAEALR